MTPGDIVRDTVLVPAPDAEGRFDAHIPEDWKVFYAFGGVTMATALRAACEAVARPDLGLVAASAMFSSPVPCGPVTCDVKLVRVGRGAVQTLTSLGAGAQGPGGLHVAATFGATATDWEPVTFTEPRFPKDVPGPQDSPVAPEPPDDAPFPRVRFHDQVEHRRVIGHASWEDGWEPGPARAVGWFRFRNAPCEPGAEWPAWSLAVPADSLGWAVAQRLGPGAAGFLVLSLQIDLHVFGLPRGDWVLQDIRADAAGRGYASGTLDLWDEDGRLLARAGQTAMLRRLPGPDPTQRSSAKRSSASETASGVPRSAQGPA